MAKGGRKTRGLVTCHACGATVPHYVTRPILVDGKRVDIHVHRYPPASSAGLTGQQLQLFPTNEVGPNQPPEVG